MDSNYRLYNHIDSADRIEEILRTPRGSYQEVDELPDRDRLTYTNGFYGMCSAIFVDIRDSSKLPQTYTQRPTLAKIYRAFVSESVAILNSCIRTREINIVGDCVWAVFNTPSTDDINEVFGLTAKLNSLMKLLNYKLAKANYSLPIRAGIGAAYGRALMIQAGYRGTGIYDVVYMGDVVNYASKLAGRANVRQSPIYQAWYTTVTYSPPIYLESVFAYNLSKENKQFVYKETANDCYTADVINTAMDQWFRDNCS